MPKLNTLFVCGRNRWRSPTAERLFRRHPHLNVRSAGTSKASPRQVRERDVAWADHIFVMEPSRSRYLRQQFHHLDLPPIDCLDIPDEYGFMDEALIELLRTSLEAYLGDLGPSASFD